MTTRLTIIGSAGTHASADRVCSSYLLSHGGTNLLLDVGSGSLHNLCKVMDVADLDAILISHMHPDHFLDLYGLQYALRFHPGNPGPIPVYAPPDAFEAFISLLPEESVQKMADLLHFRAVAAGDTLAVGSLRTELFAMNHPLECLGSRTTAGDHVVAFTGDTAPTDQITPLAQQADLFLCDATWTESQRPLPADVHCTGLEAGQAAAAAEVKRLVITHVSPYNDPQAVAKEAAKAYGGAIIVATDLMEIDLS
ncbi:MAG TPA: MBL fold metallo-hydrolase [Euzebya sp.]|nr:MBL fold metallo-hydrolase [Euzebya sp.]